MRRLLMMFALAAFVAGTTLSVGCGGDAGTKKDNKDNTEKKEDGSGDKKESASLNSDNVAMTKVSLQVDGMK